MSTNVAASSDSQSGLQMPELSIVIPAYLEEENLRILLPRVIAACKSICKDFEVVIVDTPTPLDHTKEVCAENGAIYINRSGGDSFGAAVRSGIAAAKGKYVIFMDADGSHSPEVIPELYQHRENYDVVIASRYVKGGFTENPSSLIWMSWALNLTYRWVLNLDCNDVSNSFKLYRTQDLKKVNLKCSNFDIVEEMLFKLNRKNPIKIKEIPFTFRKRMFGNTKRNLLAFMFTYFLTLLRLRFSK